jgi:hypothetical protein
MKLSPLSLNTFKPRLRICGYLYLYLVFDVAVKVNAMAFAIR